MSLTEFVMNISDCSSTLSINEEFYDPNTPCDCSECSHDEYCSNESKYRNRVESRSEAIHRVSDRKVILIY